MLCGARRVLCVARRVLCSSGRVLCCAGRVACCSLRGGVCGVLSPLSTCPCAEGQEARAWCRCGARRVLFYTVVVAVILGV